MVVKTYHNVLQLMYTGCHREFSSSRRLSFYWGDCHLHVTEYCLPIKDIVLIKLDKKSCLKGVMTCK